MKELHNSPVVFDKDTHTYLLNGVKLKGVTPIVKWVYPDTYKDIPESVLQKAAEHGRLIHSACELYDSTGIADEECEQLTDYIVMKGAFSLDTLCSEYLVDDGKAIASSIDKVYKTTEEDVYDLADIKTTSSIHEKNVTLQLSIYAWLFERNNPGVKAGRLLLVWLPQRRYGKVDLVELQRIPSDLCEKIVEGFLTGDDGQMYADAIDDVMGSGKPECKSAELVQSEDALPANLAEVENEIIHIEQTMKEMKAREEELRAGLLELMKANNVKKWTSDRLVLSRKEDSVRETVDSAKLKKMHPGVYAECKKITAVKGSLTIKIK